MDSLFAVCAGVHVTTLKRYIYIYIYIHTYIYTSGYYLSAIRASHHIAAIREQVGRERGPLGQLDIHTHTYIYIYREREIHIS